jgi:hypothetical protein
MPSLYPNKDKLILNIDVTSDPTEQRLVATVSPLAQRAVQIPIKSLSLASDEYYFAVKGKMRPTIVLAGGFVRWETRKPATISGFLAFWRPRALDIIETETGT